MGFPVGMQLATVAFGIPLTATGKDVVTKVSVKPTSTVIWAATGQPIPAFSDSFTAEGGQLGSFQVPFVDQAGFIDLAGNEVTDFAFQINASWEFANERPITWAKNLKPLVGQTGTIDLDLVPEGPVSIPVTAPTAAVLGFGGRTGFVTLQESDLPERLSVGELSATIVDLGDQRFAKPGTTLTRESNHPRARKPLAAPVFTFAQTTAPSIYWPWLVDRSASGGTGVDLDYSTDHAVDNTTSGLYRAYSATGPLGPFTSVGRYFRDSVDGTQTETPSRVWDQATSQYLIYYQQKGVPGSVGAQQTMLATGNAALSNVTRSKVMLDMVSANDPGDGHMGYFKPFTISGRNYAYHLNGGEDYGRYGLSRSEDGRTWNTDPQQIGAQIPYLRQFGAGVAGVPGVAAQTTPAKSNNVGWKSFLGYPIEWKGRVWWIGLVGPRASGATVTTNKIVAVPLREDLMGIAEPPIDITPAAQGWEGAAGITGFGNIIEYGGKFYGVYQAGGPQGGFGLLEIF